MNILNYDLEAIEFEKRKLFVGGLSWKTNTFSFENYFRQFGEISSWYIMLNWRTSKPRGFGFVTFKSEAIIQDLLNMKHVIDGKEVELKRCTPKVLNRLIRKQNEARDSRKVFLGGIPQYANETQLLTVFEQHFGPVENAEIIYWPDYCFRDGKPRSRGFGFVTFQSEEVAQRAISHKQVFFLGKQVEIKPAEPKNPCDQVLSTKQQYSVAGLSQTYPDPWPPQVSPTILPDQPVHSPQPAPLSPLVQAAVPCFDQYIPPACPTAQARDDQRYPSWLQQSLALHQQYGYMPQGLIYAPGSSPF